MNYGWAPISIDPSPPPFDFILQVFDHHAHPQGTDSAKKLDLVLDLCRDLGVIVEPTRIGDLWFVPVLSWHHQVC